MAAEEHELLKAEFWEAVESHRDAEWKDDEALAAMTDELPAAAQHVVEYMVAAYTAEAYDEVARAWEHLHQDLAIARMLYGFGAFLAAASADEEPSPLDIASGEFYGPDSDADVDGDVDQINDGYDVFGGFDAGGDADSESVPDTADSP